MSEVIRFPSRHTTLAEPLWREAVGDTVRQERLDRGERIIDVAERAGIAPQYLSEIERGRKDPSSEVLSAVAGALDLGAGEVTRRAATQMSRGPVCLAA
ncbi:DNA-binding protein [Serinicoccus chungangensis]|uniref:DNA-binding protein n=1 Tax=Serinicoccus chungangensis TaxID=767452 RepID=A0A0W8I4T0_9MICO|nr:MULTISPECIES: helix-turn-helix transcriptional regulator [Serinicoccus]KUG53247.1 DNA-binding protein [Serinicoccus chungangensis]